MSEPSPVLEAEGLVIEATAEMENPKPEAVIPAWSVRRGEFWALGGLPTSSPSQVIATLAGLVRPVSGDLRLLGQSVGTLREPELIALRQRVGLVFPSGGRLLRNLTVAENIALPLRYHRFMFRDEVDERVRQLAAELELTWHLNRSSTALSPSARQRVALARALALDPEILLLDRPFSVVNNDRHGWWQDMLGELRRGANGRKPMTIVLGSDTLRPWARTADRFAVFAEDAFVVLPDADSAAAHSSLAGPRRTRQTPPI